MKFIELSTTGINKGKYFAQVDDEDYNFLMQWMWQVTKRGHTYYASRWFIINGKRHRVYMHEMLMPMMHSGLLTEHKDGNGFNNQKYNLRPGTISQNGQNRNGNINSTSKYKGVSRLIRKDRPSSSNRWVAFIYVNNKLIYLGRFPLTPEGEIQAALTYNEVAKKHFGEFARLNIIENAESN